MRIHEQVLLPFQSLFIRDIDLFEFPCLLMFKPIFKLISGLTSDLLLEIQGKLTPYEFLLLVL
jgi:hypothetical protein